MSRYTKNNETPDAVWEMHTEAHAAARENPACERSEDDVNSPQNVFGPEERWGAQKKTSFLRAQEWAARTTAISYEDCFIMIMNLLTKKLK